MNDEEIMKKFNETFSDERIEKEKKQQPPVVPYKAMSNFSNISPSVSNPQPSSSNIPSLNQAESQSNTNLDGYSHGSNVNYNYVETPSIKKKKTVSFKLSQELLSAIVLVLLLLIAIMIIPTIYNHFTGV